MTYDLLLLIYRANWSNDFGGDRLAKLQKMHNEKIPSVFYYKHVSINAFVLINILLRSSNLVRYIFR